MLGFSSFLGILDRDDIFALERISSSEFELLDGLFLDPPLARFFFVGEIICSSSKSGSEAFWAFRSSWAFVSSFRKLKIISSFWASCSFNLRIILAKTNDNLINKDSEITRF